MNVLITGANRGIGLEFAKQMTVRGDKVIATARDPEKATELRATGAKVVALDVADAASIDALAGRVGAGAIDVLINNAGVSSKSPTLEACTMEELARVFAINSTGPVLVSKTMIDNVRAGERKMIVSITSMLGSIARNDGGSYGYRASKTALNMLTSCMARELKDITCIAMHPGWVKTDMGGENAPLPAKLSVASMLGVIERATLKDSGTFLNYDGTPLPW
jgi:NAD(P)-dependent dehydrogenase (short-subunit alcohol dehydrogenase family)